MEQKSDAPIKWYYSKDDASVGPVGRADIQALIASADLSPSSLVWRKGMVAWTSLGSTEFSRLFDLPPPLPAMSAPLVGVAPLPIGPSRAAASPALVSTPAAPATGLLVKNHLVWWLAFAPLIGALIAGFLSAMTNKDIVYFLWATLVLNVVLSELDAKALKEAGHDTAKMGLAWLVPVYLYKRAIVLQQNNAYFIVWIVCFVLSLYPG